jgi:CubicO group peptidase (beta-lactamase class C family)
MKFICSIQSEWIKRRRSAVSWLTLIGGFFIPAIILISRIIYHSQTVMGNSTDGIWMKLFNQCWQYMSVFILPMGITLAASLITQIEYRNNSWKQVFASPQSVSAIFWAKYVVVFAILFQFFILFTIGVYFTGLVPSVVYSDVPYPKEAFPFSLFLSSSCRFFIDCLPILALQYLLSIHIKNFMVSIGIGFVLVVASLIAVGWKYGYLVPYSYGSLQYLRADNKIDAGIHIQSLAITYFMFFTIVNYLLFLSRYQAKLSMVIAGYVVMKKKLFVMAIVMLSLLMVPVLFYISHAKPHKLIADSPAEVENRIKKVEGNLGAFIIPGTNDWSIKGRMDHYKVKGLSIAVVHNFKIEWAKGYGWADSSENRLVTPKTLFIPGSLSKSINAVGLLKLVQEKKIDLFDDINHYLRSWQFPYDSISKQKKITLANLLSHSAGLSVHGFPGYKNGDSFPTIVQVLNGAKPANSDPVRSMFQPGLKMEYSGGGVMISQLMLMDVARKPYDAYMYSDVLQPLGMTNSFFTQPPPMSKKNLLATGYDSAGNEVKGKYPILIEQAAGGLWTNPTDICKFIVEIQRSLQGRSNKILTKRSTELMLTPYLDRRAALGFFIEENMGYQYFGHEAGNIGFSGAFYGSMEDGEGIAVFINSENSDILKEVINSVMFVYGWKGFPEKEIIKPVVVPDTILNKYIGYYETKDEKSVLITLRIYEKDNKYWYNTNGENRVMYFTSPTEFVNNENTSRKMIKMDKNGKVTGLEITNGNKQIFFKKRVAL